MTKTSSKDSAVAFFLVLSFVKWRYMYLDRYYQKKKKYAVAWRQVHEYIFMEAEK